MRNVHSKYFYFFKQDKTIVTYDLFEHDIHGNQYIFIIF